MLERLTTKESLDHAEMFENHPGKTTYRLAPFRQWKPDIDKIGRTKLRFSDISKDPAREKYLLYAFEVFSCET